MEWLEKMNAALDYLEENLAGTIDYRKAARIACSSLTRLQRMFAFMTDMTIGEYVRCRRMTLAARDIKRTDIKIIDVAAKYGYDSPEGFARAFRAFHGIAPSQARKGGRTREYPPIRIKISIQEGNTMLGEKAFIRMEELGSYRAVAFYADCQEPETQAWNRMREWARGALTDYEARRYIGYAPRGHHPAGPEEAAHPYCAMMLLHSGEGDGDTFLGAEVVDAPKGLFLVGDVALNEYTDDGTIDIGLSMKNSSQMVYECMLHMGGYELDFDGRTYLEEHIFQKQWFTSGHPEQLLPEYKFWLPIKKTERPSGPSSPVPEQGGDKNAVE